VRRAYAVPEGEVAYYTKVVKEFEAVEKTGVAAVTIGQAATVITDGGDRLPGTVTFVSPRAEFTPRNVQTASERAKLVYRVKVAVDNRAGILKPGMPVEVDFGGGQ